MKPSEVRLVALPASPALAGLTFPFFRSLLAGETEAGFATVAYAAGGDDDPAGLCLARVQTATGAARLLSLCVAEPRRRQGWGTRLLAETEAGLRARGAREVGAIYTQGDGSPAFEAVLRKCGWAPPRVRMILCKSDAAHILQAPWIRDARLGAGFTMFPWRELPAGERDRIRQLEGAPHWHPPALSPFNDEQYYDPETSLGLRCRGELAGWVVTHRVIPGSVRYTNVFVRGDVRWKAPHLPMVAEAIRRQMASSYYPDTPFGMFNQPVDDPAVRRFFVRRLEPYLISVKHSKGSWKRLEP